MKLNPQERVHNKNSPRKIRRRRRSPKSIDRVKSEEGRKEEENNNNNKKKKEKEKEFNENFFLRPSLAVSLHFLPSELLRSFSLLNYSSRGK